MRYALSETRRLPAAKHGFAPVSMKGRYSPAECIGARKEIIEGDLWTMEDIAEMIRCDVAEAGRPKSYKKRDTA